MVGQVDFVSINCWRWYCLVLLKGA